MTIEIIKDQIFKDLQKSPQSLDEIEAKVAYPKVLVQQAIFDLIAAKKIELNTATKVLSIK